MVRTLGEDEVNPEDDWYQVGLLPPEEFSEPYWVAVSNAGERQALPE